MTAKKPAGAARAAAVKKNKGGRSGMGAMSAAERQAVRDQIAATNKKRAERKSAAKRSQARATLKKMTDKARASTKKPTDAAKAKRDAGRKAPPLISKTRVPADKPKPATVKAPRLKVKTPTSKRDAQLQVIGALSDTAKAAKRKRAKPGGSKPRRPIRFADR